MVFVFDIIMLIIIPNDGLNILYIGLVLNVSDVEHSTVDLKARIFNIAYSFNKGRVVALSLYSVYVHSCEFQTEISISK